jgi:SAGA-associated factor 73
MNEMVLAVNDKIRRSVDAVNAGFAKDKVFFVDYDAAFEGHRFCEPNITEPDYQRNETWFFLVGGNDNAGHVDPEQPRFNASDVLPPSSPLINPDICMEETTISRDWGQRALCMMAMAREREPDLRTASGDDSVHGEDMWYVPTYYGQTFHPVGRVWNQKPSGTDRRSEQRDTKPLGTQYTAAGERSFSEYRSLKTLR